VPTALLIRHGRTDANASGVLAGRTPGIGLDAVGKEQVLHTARHLAEVPIDLVVTSPLERTQQTAAYVLDAQIEQGRSPELRIDERFIECDYGSWTGRGLTDLAEMDMWRTVQQHPSAAVFPDGESMRAIQDRALAAIRELNSALTEDSVYAVVSHGDVIKAILADALGLHFDNFQRIHVEPASVSVIRYTPLRPFVVRTNDTGGVWRNLFEKDKPESSDAAVGGGA